MQIIRRKAFSRVGLIGNPSDGFHGKTISLILKNFFAEVVLYEWERIELLPSQEDHSRFDSVGDLVHDVELQGYYGGIRLVKATVKRFVEFCTERSAAGESQYALHDRKFAIRYKTNIPRQVGLAGSSAIIVATMRAMMDFYGVTIPKHIQPSLALSVEAEELGIGGGLQDRVVQVYEGLVYMDFAVDRVDDEYGYEFGSYEQLNPNLLPATYVAYSIETGEPTEVFHNPLRTLYEQGDQKVIQPLNGIAQCAAEAREALLAGEHERLASLIDRNFDLRQSICRLPDAHVQMVRAARRAGASAKFAGSGGAIIGTYRDENTFMRLKSELGKLGCPVIKPRL